MHRPFWQSRIERASVLVAVALSASPMRAQEPVDLAIVGGRVIDPGSGLDAVRNVGIRGDRVAVVTASPVSARRTINATGLVVAPGFIDILAGVPVQAEGQMYKVFDGVTTVVSMHGGPVDVERWYQARSTAGAYHHYGTTVGHQALREASGVSDRYAAATPAQLEMMLDLARDAIALGAVGIGFGVAYVPGASREEVVRLFEVAAEAGVPCHLHIRHFGPVPADNSSLDAVEEVIAAATVTGASAQIVHIGSMVASPADLRTALWMIDGARARGIDVMADVYPYTAASTGLSTTTFDPGWQERFGGIGFGDVELVSNGERLTAESFERYRAQGNVAAIIHYIPEETIAMALAHPAVMVGSDGVIENGRGHPRGAGTFSRVLGRYVRERRVLSLPDAIRKMTLMPAQRLERSVPSMARKGRLSPGVADADLVVFDPNAIADRATFADPAQRSAGVRYLVVAGQLVIEDGRLMEGVKAGRAVRKGAD
jgi:dihydroorotase